MVQIVDAVQVVVLLVPAEGSEQHAVVQPRSAGWLDEKGRGVSS